MSRVICIALSVLAVVALFSAADRASTVGIVCPPFDRDFASVLTATCGTEVAVSCPGARTNAAVAYGHTPNGFADGFVLHAWVSADDEVSVEPCCMAAVSCNPPDAGWHLRAFNP